MAGATARVILPPQPTVPAGKTMGTLPRAYGVNVTGLGVRPGLARVEWSGDEVLRNDGGDWNEPEMGALFGIKLPKIRITAKGMLKLATNLAKSPVTKAVAGGAAFVFPPVGVPLAAGVVVADRLARNVKSPNPKRRAAAKAVVVRTAQLAKAGDQSAVRGLKLIAQQQRKRTAARPQPSRSLPRPRALRFTITGQGRILPG